MATHYCPACGRFSFHGPGTASWAFECPACGHSACQHPHPPVEPPAPVGLIELPAPAVQTGPVHIGGGWYRMPDGTRIRGRDAAAEALADAEAVSCPDSSLPAFGAAVLHGEA